MTFFWGKIVLSFTKLTIFIVVGNTITRLIRFPAASYKYSIRGLDAQVSRCVFRKVVFINVFPQYWHVRVNKLRTNSSSTMTSTSFDMTCALAIAHGIMARLQNLTETWRPVENKIRNKNFFIVLLFLYNNYSLKLFVPSNYINNIITLSQIWSDCNCVYTSIQWSIFEITNI